LSLYARTIVRLDSTNIDSTNINSTNINSTNIDSNIKSGCKIEKED